MRHVVVHGPSDAIEGVGKRAAANIVVFGEHHGGRDNGKDELEQAGNHGAVD